MTYIRSDCNIGYPYYFNVDMYISAKTTLPILYKDTIPFDPNESN